MSPHTEDIQDVFAAAVPEGYDPAVPADRERLIAALGPLSEAYVVRQYRVRPKAILMEPTDWLITRDPAEVERFQPAHDCVACRAGNDQCLAYLRDHPDGWVVLGNLTYTEVWGKTP